MTLRWFRPGYLTRRPGTHLATLEFVAVDFETTGLDPTTDRIAEIAACRFTADGTILDEYATRVDPVTADVTATSEFHGLTTADVTGAPVFADAWPELSRMMSGAVVVAHNLTFEDAFLRAELGRIGVGLAGRVPGICTMVASWSHFRSPSYRQEMVFRTLTGMAPEDAHTALGDVRNLSAIIAGFRRRLPGLGYSGPAPCALPTLPRPGLMYARPIVKRSLQWNSLPQSSARYPLSGESFRSGTLRLLESGRREDLAGLMGEAGVGAEQFARTLATTIAGLIADGKPAWEDGVRAVLDDLMEWMGSAEFTTILTGGIAELAGTAEVTAWAARRRARHGTSLPVPIGVPSSENPPFDRIDPELPPDWRWTTGQFSPSPAPPPAAPEPRDPRLRRGLLVAAVAVTAAVLWVLRHPPRRRAGRAG